MITAQFCTRGRQLVSLCCQVPKYKLYKQYLSSLDALNKNHSNENRLNFNAAKQKYKVTKNKLKRQYKNQQGNMMNNLRRKNPKNFTANLRVKKGIYSDITIEQFEEHFRKLMNKDNK